MLYEMEQEEGGVIKFTPRLESRILRAIFVQNMVGENGIYYSTPQWINSAAALHFRADNVTYGQKFRVSLRRLVTYGNMGNWKWLRVWNGQPGNPHNWYIGQPYEEWVIHYTEPLPVNPSTRITLTSYPFPSAGIWRKEVFEWQAPSACGIADGKLKITIDDTWVAQFEYRQMDSPEFPGVPNYICIQDDPSNFSPPAGSEVRYKDVIVELL